MDKKQLNILILDIDKQYANCLKKDLGDIHASVTLVDSIDAAKTLLAERQDFFISITTIDELDDYAYEKADLLAKYKIPIIAIVKAYSDDLRNKMIKRNVIDYIVKENLPEDTDTAYICELISRVYHNTSTKVLVVDDSIVSQFVLRRELALQQFQVLCASNGKDALKLYDEHPDIKFMLVDQQMVAMDGITLVKKLRKKTPKSDLVIIGISTSSDPKLAVRFLKAGANDFISKPFNYEMLLCRSNQNLDMLDAITAAKGLANTDYLSQLYNRRYLFEYGNQLLEDNPIETTVIVLDIDHFRSFNDQYGNHLGDAMIQHFAEQLAAYFEDDMIARYEGDKFVVVNHTLKATELLEYLDQFRLSLSNESIEAQHGKIQYTCSIGASNVIKPTILEMINDASMLLDTAKQNGRNRVEVATD